MRISGLSSINPSNVSIYLFFLIVLFHYVYCFTSPALVSIQGNGSFAIDIKNSQTNEVVNWFNSGDVRIYSGGWYSLAGGNLTLNGAQVIENGVDSIGSYAKTVTPYITANSIRFNTTIKIYTQKPVIVFEQIFVDGCASSSIGDKDLPLSEYPTLQKNDSLSLGYLHYNGFMGGYDWQSGLWPLNYNGGYEGGPLVWFDQDMNTTVVLSSLNYFTLGIKAIVERQRSRVELAVGLEGQLTSIPSGFVYQSVMYFGSSGINDAMMRWGDVLLHYYNKQRPTPNSLKSVVLDYIGYSTTAFYFYNPLQGDANTGNYQETLIAVHKYNQQMKLPYHYYLIDSFWYGEQYYNNSVYLWQDSDILTAQRFPNGLQWLREQLGVPIMAHMGKWSSQTPYANEFDFIVEANYSIPQSIDFWEYVMRNASGWGLVTLKQDHMNEQVLDMNAPLQQVDVIRNWLLQQGRGCADHGITIMYCMDYPNFFMESLEIGATATHSRASDDYTPNDASKNWQVGVTSMLLWSIGLYPYKDAFYSSTNEVVLHPNAKFYNFTEPYPITHAVVSVLSAGPVAPSDGIGGANYSLIIRTCRVDGMILKPDRPAVSIDRYWIQKTFGNEFISGQVGPKGEVWTTYTQISASPSNTWHYFLGVNLLENFQALPSDLLLPSASNLVAFSYNSTTLGTIDNLVTFSAQQPLLIPEGRDYGNFTLWTICPEIYPGAPMLLGEVGKILPVSIKRFSSVIAYPGELILNIIGAPGEVVSFALIASISELTNIQVESCIVSASGTISYYYSTGLCI